MDSGLAFKIQKAREAGIPEDVIQRKAYQDQVMQQQQQQKAPEADSGNILTSKKSLLNLSTIGSIAGSVLGGIGGAFAAPFTAGVINPVTGAIAGGAVGGAGGEALRQKLNHEDTNIGDIATEGAWGAASEVGGQILGKGAKLLTKGVGNVLTKEGESLAVKGLKMSDAQLAKYAETHGGEKVAQTLNKYGLAGKGAQDIENKALKPLQESFDQITNKSGAIVDPTDLVNNFANQIDALRASPVAQNKALADKMEAELMNIIDSSGKGDLDISKLNKFRKEYDVVTKDFAADPEKAGINRRVGDILRTTAQQTADKAGLTGPNGESLKEIGSELNKLYDLHNTAVKNEFKGQGGSIIKGRDLLATGVGGMAGGLPGAAGAVAVSRVLDNPKVVGFLSRAASAAGNKLTQEGATSVGKTIAGKTGAQIVGHGAEQLFGAGGGANPMELPADVNSVDFSTPGQENQLPPTPTVIPQPNSGGAGGSPMLSPDFIKFAIAKDIIENKGKNVDNLKTLYATVSGPTAKPATAQQAQAAGFATRLSTADQLLDKYSAVASSPSYMIKDKLPNVFKGSDAQVIDQAQRNFINAVLRRESGAAISQSEFDNARVQYLPQPGDSKEVLAQKAISRKQVIASLNNEANASPATLPASPSDVTF